MALIAYEQTLDMVREMSTSRKLLQNIGAYRHALRTLREGGFTKEAQYWYCRAALERWEGRGYE